MSACMSSGRFARFILLFAVLGLGGCLGGGGGEPDPGTTPGGGTPAITNAVSGFNSATQAAVDTNVSFIEETQKWESANFSALSAAQVKALAASYLKAGADFHAALQNYNTQAAALGSLSKPAWAQDDRYRTLSVTDGHLE